MTQLTRRQLLLAGAAGTAVAAGGLWRLADDDPVAPRLNTTDCATPPPGASRRPGPALRLDAQDAGVVLRHGDGPNGSDGIGARDVVTWRVGNTWYMHYDGAGQAGWLVCLATSPDGTTWTKKGPVLDFGPPGAADHASAAYGFPVQAPDGWHLFYLGARTATPPPDRVPAVPYATLKARGPSPEGPWTKQPDVVPFSPQPGTYYADTAAPGSVFARGEEYWQFFSAAAMGPDGTLQRTLGRATTRNLDGPWTVDSQPILPPTEQIENSAVYYEPSSGTWFLFTNHVGLEDIEYTDAVWVYWTQDPQAWDPARKAVVLDGRNCCWSRRVIGLPSIVPVEGRIALFYDGLEGTAVSHVGRDVGLAWLPRPLVAPA